jgi:hypothetical protein
VNDLMHRFGMMRKIMKNMGNFKKMMARAQRAGVRPSR